MKNFESFIRLITIVAVPLLGIAALAYFRHCDPMQANIGEKFDFLIYFTIFKILCMIFQKMFLVQKKDQVMPLLTMKVSEVRPGLAGLYISAAYR